MLKKKGVLKYQNGEIIKGWVEEFKPERESFFLFPLIEYSEEERMEIKLSSLKAVFFVKDFMGDKDYKKVRTFNVDLKITPSQRKLVIHFLYPIDPKDNSERIFVVHKAIESVRLTKIEI
jgi:hypothetical protein